MTAETFLNGRVTLHCGDCLDVLATMSEDSVDSVVCDPPYHLHSIVKRFAKTGRTDKTRTTSGPHQRTASGFMNKKWDGGDVAFKVETWRAVLRVLKPGGYIVAFSSSRTFGRMSVAIEDAGFITHPLIGWIFGQGFPKAHRVHLEGYEGFRYGGQALKPALEPIYMGQKPFTEVNGTQNVAKWGTGALNIDGCRVETDEGLNGGAYRDGEASADRTYADKGGTNFAVKPGMRRGRSPMNGDQRSGAALGMFREAKTVGAEFKQPPGRWPANVILDGSDEVAAAFPETASGALTAAQQINGGWKGTVNCYGTGERGGTNEYEATVGSAARFFYAAKADVDDRIGSKHPTVKPLDLIQHLVRLVTPPAGLVLDCFAGTGTTGEAVYREGCSAILIEREPEYQADIRRRMALTLAGPDERLHATVRAKGLTQDAGPLFAEVTA